MCVDNGTRIRQIKDAIGGHHSLNLPAYKFNEMPFWAFLFDNFYSSTEALMKLASNRPLSGTLHMFALSSEQSPLFDNALPDCEITDLYFGL